MGSKKRLKEMDWDELANVRLLDWERVELTGQASPTFLTNLVNKMNCHVYASGIMDIEPQSYNDQYEMYQIAGIDVLRYAGGIPSGVMWDKDSYLVFSDNSSGAKLMVAGPFKRPNDHWLNKIPGDYDNAEIHYFNSPKCPKCGKIYDSETGERL